MTAVYFETMRCLLVASGRRELLKQEMMNFFCLVHLQVPLGTCGLCGCDRR